MKFTVRSKKQEKKKHITINLPSEKYDLVSKTAKQNGVSIKEYCRQTVAYAMGWEQ